MALLTVEGVTSGYGDVTILHSVSIEIEPTEVVSIIGPNGAGKSTLMKTIFGLLHPSEGRIQFDGNDIAGRSPYEMVTYGMCYVPQVSNVFASLTVEENLEVGAYVLPSRELKARKDRIYEIFPRLRERRRQRAGLMSGGERQMVAMGSALMLDPKLILLDEPSAGLSPVLVDSIFERIKLVNQTGVAVLMVEQNAKKSLEMADRGYVLSNGRNRVDGPGQELLDDPEVGRLYLGG